MEGKEMFQHVLIPIDGSPIARKAARAAIALAKGMGAKVTLYYAMEPLEMYYVDESIGIGPKALRTLEKNVRVRGERALAEIEPIAVRAQVPYESVLSPSASPYEGILAVAKKQKCDLIYMASHGRTGLRSLLMGSVTQKVLANAKIPVLVYR
jgi:nucleotide-binding universal stress UspA family protein